MPVSVFIAAVLSVAFASVALAEPPTAAPALAFAADDARLHWGPCPAFIPKGCEIAVLHGDPAKPNADIFFRVPGGMTVPRHWHSSAERMVLVAGRLEVSYDGQPPVTLQPGMYAYGPAKLPHSAVCAPGAACVLFIAFEGPVDAVPTDAGHAQPAPGAP